MLYMHCSETVPVQCKREGKGTLLYPIKSDPVQCKRSLNFQKKLPTDATDNFRIKRVFFSNPYLVAW